MRVPVKRLSSDAVIPTYAKPGDAGLDIVATRVIDDGDMYITYGTDISLEIPEGYVGLIFPRSSIRKYDLLLSNSVGVVDSGYRGEIQFTFIKSKDFGSGKTIRVYNIGDRIGQIIIVPYPQIEFDEVDELSDSERGYGGFGHTGN